MPEARILLGSCELYAMGQKANLSNHLAECVCECSCMYKADVTRMGGLFVISLNCCCMCGGMCSHSAEEC